MKRHLSVALALTLVLTSLLSVLVLPTSAASVEDSLVVHYDFEGATIGEALSDKASAGTVNDKLSCYPNGKAQSAVADDSEEFRQNMNWNQKDGTMTSVAKGAGLQAKNSKDLQSFYGLSTTVMRFQVPELNEKEYAYLGNLQSNWNNTCYSIYATKKDGNTKLEICTTKHSSNMTSRAWTPLYNGLKSNTYVNFALQMQMKGGDTGLGDVTFSGFLAYGDPTMASDWQAIESKTIKYHRNNDSFASAPFSMFDISTKSKDGITFIYDDYRLYTCALTAEQLTAIFNQGNYDKNPTVWQSRTDADRYDVRFCTVTQELDLAACDAVGYDIVASYVKDGQAVTSAVKTCETTTVYKSILAATDGNLATVTAESLGGVYIFAVRINGIANSLGNVTLTVRPFQRYGTEKIYEPEVCITVNSGSEVVG